MAYSFYGGKSGSTYHLVAHFNSIKDMVDHFQMGGNYNDVNYNEYVIIDTIASNDHFNSPENGIIYRRGFNYTEEFNPNNLSLNKNNTIEHEDTDSSGNRKYYTKTTNSEGAEVYTFLPEKFRSDFNSFVINPGGGAEYVGQIVGPQGQCPRLSILDWNNFLSKYNAAVPEAGRGTVHATSSPGARVDSNGNLVSGSTLDYIKYGYLNVKDIDGNIYDAYIAMDIPYSVFNMHAESIEPYDSGFATYDSSKNIWTYKKLIAEDTVSKTHPYYWQYGIKVPKGIKGQDLQKLDITHTGKTLNNGNDVDQSDHNYQYYYITRNYDKSATGETKQTYLDAYDRSIYKTTNNGHVPTYTKVKRNTAYAQGSIVSADGLANNLFLRAATAGTTASTALPSLELYKKNKTFKDGTVTWQIIEDTITSPNLITVHYTHGNNDEVKIRVMDDILLDETTGRIYVKYSDLDTLTYLGENQNIIGVKYVDTPWKDSNGKSHIINRIYIQYNTYNYDSDGNIVVDSNFSVDSNGNLIFPTTDSKGRKIQYIDQEFKFVDKITINEKTREVTVRYNDGTSNSLGILRGIDKIGINENTREVTVYYNDSTTSSLGVLKSISSIDETNEGDISTAKYLTATYNTKTQVNGSWVNDTARITKNALNEIVCIKQRGDDLIVLYSDPTVRKTLYNAATDYALSKETYTTNTAKTKIFNYDVSKGSDDGKGNLYWINLGATYRGNHVFGGFSSLATLKAEYPYGFGKDTSGNVVASEENHTGWLATVTDSDGVKTYAYDYHGSAGWYLISDTSKSTIKPGWSIIAATPSSTDQAVPASGDEYLNADGFWLVETVTNDADES